MKDKIESKRQIVLRFSNPRYINIVKSSTELIAKQMGFSEEQACDITMAVDEAYTNSIEHTSGGAQPLEVEIEYLICSDRLEISIKDSGCGFNSCCHHIPLDLNGLETIRGRGLSLIRMLSDGFELASSPGEGTIIRIIKYLSTRAKKQLTAPA